MALLPADIPTGLVTADWWFVDDDGDDTDTDPEVSPVTGGVTFSASVPLIRIPGKPATVIPLKFHAIFNPSGRLVPKLGTGDGIRLPATDSPLTNPTGFTWKVEFDIKDATTGQPIKISSFDIQVPANATVDLTSLVPVASSAGTITVQGPKGDVGPVGPKGTGIGVNVKDFGAKGDSSTDDTAAIKAAINSLPSGGGSVFFPAGTYVISDAIQARNALKIFGEGNSSSVIYQTMPNKHGIAGTDILSFSIEDIRVVGAGSGAGIGIMFERYNNDATNYIHAKNVYVRTFGKDGIYVSNGIVSRFDTVISESNGGNGFNLVGLNGVIGTSTSLNNCFANANALSGYRMDTMGYMNFNACAADNNAIGYEMLNAIGLTFNGCGAEGSTTAAFKIDAGYGNTISGGWMYKNKAIGVLITNNSIGATITGLSETSPEATATACVQVDAGSKATLLNIHNDKPNVLAAGTTQIINDVSGASSFNGSMDIQGALTLNGFNVSTQRGARWYVSDATTPDFSNVSNPIANDIFLYPNSRDIFQYDGAAWVYKGSIMTVKGDPGDLSPVSGPSTQATTLALTAAMLPSTQLITLGGNVTVTLETPAAGSKSGTITLVLTQDATGSRTITWPASVKWSEGISAQPSTAASSKSVFHLMWTGQEWLGMLGGRSFA